MKLTKEEVLTMEAGREMDKLVAEKVIQTSGIFNVGLYWYRNESIKDMLPTYSSDISAAWEVSQHIPCIQLQRKQDGEYVVRWGSYSEKAKKVTAITASEAICKAALLAVMDL